jgi:hypothetical protein
LTWRILYQHPRRAASLVNGGVDMLFLLPIRMTSTSGYISRTTRVFNLSKVIFGEGKRKSADQHLRKHLLGVVIAFHLKDSFKSSSRTRIILQ